MRSYRQGRKIKQRSYNVGNNRPITEARAKQRFGRFGTVLPKRMEHFLQMLAFKFNNSKAKKHLQEGILGSMSSKAVISQAVRSLRNLRQNRREDAATKRMNEWDAKKQELLEQNDRALFGHTKKAVQDFLLSLGYYTQYSGKLKHLFITGEVAGKIPTGNPVSIAYQRYSDLPFIINYDKKYIGLSTTN